MTADKGFAIAVFIYAHRLPDMVREILCLTQTILRASMEYVCSAHLPDASTKGRIQTVPLYIRKFPYIRPTILLLLYLSFLFSSHICATMTIWIILCNIVFAIRDIDKKPSAHRAFISVIG